MCPTVGLKSAFLVAGDSFSFPAGFVLLASFLSFDVFCVLPNRPLCYRPNSPPPRVSEIACEVQSLLLCLRRARCDRKYGLLIWRTPAGLARRAVRLTGVCYFKPQRESGCRVTPDTMTRESFATYGAKCGSHLKEGMR